MDPNLIGQIILVGLETFKLILSDIPKERRVQAWVEFFDWVDDIRAMAKRVEGDIGSTPIIQPAAKGFSLMRELSSPSSPLVVLTPKPDEMV